MPQVPLLSSGFTGQHAPEYAAFSAEVIEKQKPLAYSMVTRPMAGSGNAITAAAKINGRKHPFEHFLPPYRLATWLPKS